jgi:zinc finger protein
MSLFSSIEGDVLPTEIESLCMSCEENGTTRLLLTKIPHFKEVIIMAFECPHCGFKNNEIQSASVIAPQGQTQILSIHNTRDLSRQVVKAESASIIFKEIEFEIPPSSQRGSLSTIEGILDRSIDGLSQDQERRKVRHFYNS